MAKALKKTITSCSTLVAQKAADQNLAVAFVASGGVE